jgi:transcriptional regulator with XRE-family HTH domain
MLSLGNIDNLSKDDVQKFYLRIGKNVAKFRKEKGLSQLELSLMLGYKSSSQVAGSEICYKNYHFNIEQLLKLSIIFKVDICEFFK